MGTENEILQAMIDLLPAMGMRLIVPMFDGAIVAASDYKQQVGDAALGELAKKMREEHGIVVVEKPLDAGARALKRVKREL